HLPDRIELVVWKLAEHYAIRELRGQTMRRCWVSGARIIDAGFCSQAIRVIFTGQRQVSRTLGEVTGTLQVGGDESFQVDRILQANLLEIDKKECLVFIQRPAE